jgi:colanic acid biosynthesis glycosyl transferase WcaI
MIEKTGGGLLVEPDDPGALADGLLRIWGDPALASALAAAGAAGVREHYDVGRMAEVVEAIYDDLRRSHARSRESGTRISPVA